MPHFNLEVPDELWNEWRDTVSRSMSLNDAIIELIRDDVERDD